MVRGNHDKACTGQDDLEWFNPVARAAALWTLQALTPGERRLHRATCRKGRWSVDGFQLVHGSPFDEDEYVLAADEAGAGFRIPGDAALAFFGHTHVQGGFIWNHSRVETIPRTSLRSDRQVMEIDAGCAYLINPGSVGPAARRRSAGGLCVVRFGRADGHLLPGALRRRHGTRQDSSLRAAARSGGQARR